MDIVFALSLLLTAGFAGAMLARLLRLPSVTGYILAGVLIGPTGLKLIPAHLLESGLGVFTNIALMLVAFGIGERLDLQQLQRSARAVTRVSLGESVGPSCWWRRPWASRAGIQGRVSTARQWRSR